MRSCLEIHATMVADEFIDRYMVAANGEYIKVYLYVLRHQGQIRDAGEIADALNHTEADVMRALNYWVRQGVLESVEFDHVLKKTERRETGTAVGKAEVASADQNGWRKPGGARAAGRTGAAETAAAEIETAGTVSLETVSQAASVQIPERRRTYTPEQVGALAKQEDFTQLLYISQKYMNKIFTPRECEVFAYLYDGLHMSVELLEYLVEYCVQGGHYSIRYLESVALNWHEKGISDVNNAREYTSTFSREGFAVMRAFGISDRRPGDGEQKMIERWFKEFGFSKEIVLEACNRTLKAIHKPSFSYADKILSEWKKANVRSMSDVKKLDEKREEKREQEKGRERTPAVAKPQKNQFHNFEQRSTNYDAMVLERLKERLGEQQ